MLKRLLMMLTCTVILGLSSLAQNEKSSSAQVPDKAYMQKVWDAWATLDPAKEAPFHAQGAHVYYDESPLSTTVGLSFNRA